MQQPERTSYDGEFDSGEIETLPDGSISIPILEEEVVVTKRIVVRERVIVHKDTEIEHRTVNAELRRERVDIQDVPAPGASGERFVAQRDSSS